MKKQVYIEVSAHLKNRKHRILLIKLTEKPSLFMLKPGQAVSFSAL